MPSIPGAPWFLSTLCRAWSIFSRSNIFSSSPIPSFGVVSLVRADSELGPWLPAPCVFTTSCWKKASCEVFCCLRFEFELANLHPSLSVQAFTSVSYRKLICRLLTSAVPAKPLDLGYEVHFVYGMTSPGKSVIFLSIYPPHLPTAPFGSKDFILYGRLVQLQ